MNKETIKKFLEFNRVKLVIFVALFALLLFFGFFKTSGCFLDENGIKVCRECGVEGIFNPLLRPFSFIFANLIQGLILNGNIALCGISGAVLAWFLYFPLDAFYLYLLSCLIISVYNKIKAKK